MSTPYLFASADRLECAMKNQILVVDNSQDTFNRLKSLLEHEDVEVFCAKTVAEALSNFSTYDYCLAFIDIHLTWEEKIELVHIMKSIKVIPIIVFSGPLSKNNLRELFLAGASVVLKKPVDYEILLLQTHNFIELYSEIANAQRGNHPLAFGPEFVIEPQSRRVTINGTLLCLTRKEYDLLFCLANYPGQILSHEQLYEQVWKEESDIGVNSTVRVHIGKLKKKLSTVSDFDYVHNVWGVGYKFVPPPNESK